MSLLLECVKEKSKLRVRILTQGYYRDANCQFPRDLRVEGRKFEVKAENVKLINTRGKYYYSVRDRAHIKILEEAEIDLSQLKIYQDEDTDDCAICLSETKDSIFFPCGHFYTCESCSKKVQNCPVCRAKISQIIPKEQIG